MADRGCLAPQPDTPESPFQRQKVYPQEGAIRKLAHPDAASIPIIAMTANAFNEDVAAATAAGMNGHISKSIDTDLLHQTLALCLRKRKS